MVWDASGHRDSHRTWEIGIPCKPAGYMVSKLSAQSLPTLDVYGNSIQGKKPCNAWSNRFSSFAGAKVLPRRSTSYPLWKTMTDSFAETVIAETVGMWLLSFVPCNAEKRADNIFSVAPDYIAIQAMENSFEYLDWQQTHPGLTKAKLHQMLSEYACCPEC